MNYLLIVSRERVAEAARVFLTRATCSSVEGREDPAVVSFDAVVGNDGVAAAAAGDADEGAVAGDRTLLAVFAPKLRAADAGDEAGDLWELLRERRQSSVVRRGRRLPFGVLGDVADEADHRLVARLDGAPLAALGEWVARGAGAQHLDLLRPAVGRHSFEQLVHRGRQRVRQPTLIADVHPDGLGHLLAARDGFELKLAARLLADARCGGHQ